MTFEITSIFNKSVQFFHDCFHPGEIPEPETTLCGVGELRGEELKTFIADGAPVDAGNKRDLRFLLHKLQAGGELPFVPAVEELQMAKCPCSVAETQIGETDPFFSHVDKGCVAHNMPVGTLFLE